MTSMYNHSCCIDYLIGSRLHNLVPFAWCHSIRLSSLRALVRFSSWSWRWMFSSIRAWMVSWSSKFNVGRTSRTRGAKNSSGFGPLMAALVPGTKITSSDGGASRRGKWIPFKEKSLFSAGLRGARRFVRRGEVTTVSFQGHGWKAAAGLL